MDTADLSVLAVPGMEAGKPMAYAEAAEALRHLQQEDPARARGLKILRLSELQGATAGPDLTRGDYGCQRTQIMCSCPGCGRGLPPAFRRPTA